MNFTYRKATEAERDQYLDFANLVFSNAHRPHDFATLISKVYGTGKHSAWFQNIAVDEQSRIRGLIALMPNTLNVMGEELVTGYVGTVSVHPYARGEGHMKHLMAMVGQDIIDRNIDIAMLGGQRQRYEYFGFTKGGMLWSYDVGTSNVRHALKDVCDEGIEITDICPDDMETLCACAELNESRKLYAPRKAEEFHEIATTWYAQLKKVTKDGAFAGYLVMHHEGSQTSIEEFVLKDFELTGAVLKAWFRQTGTQGCSLIVPDYETELVRRLANFAERQHLCDAQQIRIAHFGKVLGAFMRLKASYAPLADGERSFRIGDENVTIRVKDNQVTVTDECKPDAVELTPKQAQMMFFNLNGALTDGRLPAGWAPLPLFLNHADCF